ncbi:unnamed protein product [Somion occarium]|uniref:C2H2-type domain-containing protein n=1 Tax=Somion occarium TaxID=3059160 RepID=A0ABP1D7F1_9APHY
MRRTQQKSFNEHFLDIAVVSFDADAEVFRCRWDGCNYIASKHYRFKLHTKVHFEAKDFPCEYGKAIDSGDPAHPQVIRCPYEASSPQAYRQHRHAYHWGQDPLFSAPTSPRDTLYYCDTPPQLHAAISRYLISSQRNAALPPASCDEGDNSTDVDSSFQSSLDAPPISPTRTSSTTSSDVLDMNFSSLSVPSDHPVLYPYDGSSSTHNPATRNSNDIYGNNMVHPPSPQFLISSTSLGPFRIHSSTHSSTSMQTLPSTWNQPTNDSVNFASGMTPSFASQGNYFPYVSTARSNSFPNVLPQFDYSG